MNSNGYVSSADVKKNGNATVIVAFQVAGLTPEEAERVVTERLDRLALQILYQNDSTDWQRGTADPIVTYAVLPVAQALEDAT